MAQQLLELGTVGGDGTGTKLRAGGEIINENFTELYADVAQRMLQFNIYGTPDWVAENEYAIKDTFKALQEGGSTGYFIVHTAFTSDLTYDLTGKETANTYCFYVQPADESDPIFQQWLNATPPAYPSDLHNPETATSIGNLHLTDIHVTRGNYVYQDQVRTADTAGDWRNYSDGSGFYTQYCTVGNATKGAGTWVTKFTIQV